MSLAAIKRKLVLGAKLEMVRHDWGPNKLPYEKIAGIRRIEKVHTTGVCFEGGSWLQFPKACRIRETDKGFQVALKPDFSELMEYEYR